MGKQAVLYEYAGEHARRSVEFFSFFFLSLVGSRDNTWITSVIDDDAKKILFPSFPFPFPPVTNAQYVCRSSCTTRLGHLAGALWFDAVEKE